MPTVKLTSYEMHALKEVVRAATQVHNTQSGADQAWQRREGKALEKAVEKMDAARKAETTAVLSRVQLGSVTPMKRSSK